MRNQITNVGQGIWLIIIATLEQITPITKVKKEKELIDYMKTDDQTALKLNIWTSSSSHFAWFTYGVPIFCALIGKTEVSRKRKPTSILKVDGRTESEQTKSPPASR